MGEGRIKGDVVIMINFGCGTHLHSDWLNVDFSPLSWRVRHPVLLNILGALGLISEQAYHDFQKYQNLITRVDLSRFPLPFPDDYADVIYHSHFLEHLAKRDGFRFHQEAFRILKPGGILRIVVPDLELIVNEYISAISPVYDQNKHEKALNDLFDQIVRNEFGGINDLETKPSFAARVKKLLGVGSTPEKCRELHRWMYDKYALLHISSQLGFQDTEIVDYKTSNIPGWTSYCLDNNENGSSYKEKSLYFEARKRVLS